MVDSWECHRRPPPRRIRTPQPPGLARATPRRSGWRGRTIEVGRPPGRLRRGGRGPAGGLPPRLGAQPPGLQTEPGPARRRRECASSPRRSPGSAARPASRPTPGRCRASGSGSPPSSTPLGITEPAVVVGHSFGGGRGHRARPRTPPIGCAGSCSSTRSAPRRGPGGGSRSGPWRSVRCGTGACTSPPTCGRSGRRGASFP